MSLWRSDQVAMAFLSPVDFVELRHEQGERRYTRLASVLSRECRRTKVIGGEYTSAVVEYVADWLYLKFQFTRFACSFKSPHVQRTLPVTLHPPEAPQGTDTRLRDRNYTLWEPSNSPSPIGDLRYSVMLVGPSLCSSPGPKDEKL